MFQNVLEKITGIGFYGAVSIAIFFTVFTLMLVWVFGLKKSYINTMGSLPLSEEGRSPESNRNPQS